MAVRAHRAVNTRWAGRARQAGRGGVSGGAQTVCGRAEGGVGCAPVPGVAGGAAGGVTVAGGAGCGVARVAGGAGCEKR